MADDFDPTSYTHVAGDNSDANKPTAAPAKSKKIDWRSLGYDMPAQPYQEPTGTPTPTPTVTPTPQPLSDWAQATKQKIIQGMSNVEGKDADQNEAERTKALMQKIRGY